jgi:hypothetical protein
VIGLIAGGVVLTVAAFGTGVVVGFGAAETTEAADSTDTTEDEADGSGEMVDVYELRRGHCIRELPLHTGPTLEIVDCDQRHDAEVYGLPAIDEPLSASFPGDDVLLDRAESLCIDEFDTYVGRTYSESDFEFGFFYPSEESWDEDDREVVCYAWDPIGPLNETIRDANR